MYLSTLHDFTINCFLSGPNFVRVSKVVNIISHLVDIRWNDMCSTVDRWGLSAFHGASKKVYEDTAPCRLSSYLSCSTQCWALLEVRRHCKVTDWPWCDNQEKGKHLNCPPSATMATPQTSHLVRKAPVHRPEGATRWQCLPNMLSALGSPVHHKKEFRSYSNPRQISS